jgi:hypothetical protein
LHHNGHKGVDIFYDVKIFIMQIVAVPVLKHCTLPDSSIILVKFFSSAKVGPAGIYIFSTACPGLCIGMQAAKQRKTVWPVAFQFAFI